MTIAEKERKNSQLIFVTLIRSGGVMRIQEVVSLLESFVSLHY